MILDIRSPEFRTNPYPAFRRLRAEAPICRIEPHGHWAVARHSDVLQILKNPKRFPSTGNTSETARGPELLVYGRTLIGSNPPEHTRLRSLVGKAFTPIMVKAQEQRIRSVSRDLIEGFRRRDTFDLVSDFSMPLPMIIISELIGIDPSRRADFKRWTNTLLTWRNAQYISEPDKRAAREREIKEDLEQMFDYLSGVIAERRREPKTDLISALVQACDDDQRLSPLEVISFVRLLLVAGNETTTNLIGNTCLALTSRPELWARVKRDPSLIPQLVEESLRFDSPVLSLSRRADADTIVAGVKVAKDELVLPLLASANHDEAVFAEPERFDIERNTQGHLSFGAGIHFCLGAPLARLQARIAFEELTAALDGVERADSAPLDFIDSFFFRGAKALLLRTNSQP